MARYIPVISAASVGLGIILEHKYTVLKWNPFSKDNCEEGLLPYVIPSVSAASTISLKSPSMDIVPHYITSDVVQTNDIMKFGYPSLENVKYYNGFVVAYDKRNRVPHWVFEKLDVSRIVKADNVDRSQCLFHEDLSVHEYFRATNKDYKGSTYDRGHLAAAGNHRWSQHAMEQTFTLSNMSPQVCSLQNYQ